MKFVFVFPALLVLQLATPASANEAPVRDNLRSLAQAQQSHPQETLQGMITAVDERNNRVTLRLASDNNSEFRVQDGLVFNAIHTGDRVEITVETIAGAKTIVELKKL